MNLCRRTKRHYDLLEDLGLNDIPYNHTLMRLGAGRPTLELSTVRSRAERFMGLVVFPGIRGKLLVDSVLSSRTVPLCYDTGIIKQKSSPIRQVSLICYISGVLINACLASSLCS